MPKFCPTCGKPLQFENAEICPNCGVRIHEQPTSGGERYAGFWIRFGAYLIDSIILFIIFLGIAFIVGAFLGVAFMGNSYLFNSALSGMVVLIYLLMIPITWLYFAIQESSSKQATVGKQAVGIIVTDIYGNRLSFGRATGRWFAKILSILIFAIGYIMIGFTERKQGLHDLIASTYVVYRPYT